ncbi:hypothetical protein LSAT2_028824, partial [Lamellibrachia satsuma]
VGVTWDKPPKDENIDSVIPVRGIGHVQVIHCRPESTRDKTDRYLRNRWEIGDTMMGWNNSQIRRSTSHSASLCRLTKLGWKTSCKTFTHGYCAGVQVSDCLVISCLIMTG